MLKKSESKTKIEERTKNTKLSYILKNYQLYLMALPGIILLLLFKYVPMYGLLIAFKKYNVLKGVMGSKWVGLEHFQRFLTMESFKDLFMNTFSLSVYGLLFGFGFPILIALLLNQIRYTGLKNNIQLILYAPNFISTVVVVGMIFIFFAPNGPTNMILAKIGIEPIMFMTEPQWFQPLYISTNIWQSAGWGSVIYLAALSNVDPQLHEAAKIDGANILQRIRHIEIPTILPVASILLILSVGGIMALGHEKAYIMQTSLNMSKAEILATYVYKIGLQAGDYSFSTAVGLFNSIINLFLLVSVNFVVKKFNKSSGL